ncbi:hypothetical protein ILUMI_06217 [Ignelater luminosus]|uniref:Uncharacterized protein n=1 Tax=Ignelater luminosus TaxID=2038154 RepID=A0A8K0GCT2_IGNLU|nr:hypothetical protein ILUMI_06217 [Ignelater luminosus]
MNNEKKPSKYEQGSIRHASTPTANYIITPRSLVCPGQLSRNVSKQWSLNPSLRVHQKDSSKSSIKTPKMVIPPQVQTATPKSALVVSPTQGIFEIHLKYLDLSDIALERISSQFEGETPIIRISWKFFSFERSTIPMTNSVDSHYQIESSVLYKVDINENFFEYALTRDLSLELYARGKSKEAYLARGELKLNDVLDYPLNELYAYVDLCDVDKALVLSNTGIAIVYGTLALWFRLSCDMDVLSIYLNRAGHVYYSASTSNAADKMMPGGPGRRKSSVMTLLRNPDQRQFSTTSRRTSLIFHLPEEIYEETESVNSLEPTESEMESFKEALDLVLSRNKALRTTQSEISNELHDRARWLHEESNWKRTLQEYAILCGRDPADVEWRQWRDAETADVKLRKYTSQTIIYKPEVIISIEYLKLYKNSPPMLNEKLKKFYVEFSFLHYNGIDMECPFSLPKSSESGKMVFNFSKHFYIDSKTNHKDANSLAQAVKGGGEIKFVVVGEPEQETHVPLCCEEVSSCSLNLLELVQLETNFMSDSLALYDTKDDTIEIGFLRVHINGILAMRRCALQILAPPGYSILE